MPDSMTVGSMCSLSLSSPARVDEMLACAHKNKHKGIENKWLYFLSDVESMLLTNIMLYVVILVGVDYDRIRFSRCALNRLLSSVEVAELLTLFQLGYQVHWQRKYNGI